jgi:hypothetical protein
VLARYNTLRRLAALTLAVIAWSALLLQLCLTINNYAAQGRPASAAILFYLGFFTVLTNLLAAICLSCAAMQKDLSARMISFAAAATAYMAMVGIIYSLLLRHVWEPQAWQKVADVLLHDVMPVSIFLFWLLLVPKKRLNWRSPLPWLIYPLGYLGVTLLVGAATGRYPYPFVDVGLLGYGRVSLNAVMITLAFLILSYVLVAIDRAVSTLR